MTHYLSRQPHAAFSIKTAVDENVWLLQWNCFIIVVKSGREQHLRKKLTWSEGMLFGHLPTDRVKERRMQRGNQKGIHLQQFQTKLISKKENSKNISSGMDWTKYGDQSKGIKNPILQGISFRMDKYCTRQSFQTERKTDYSWPFWLPNCPTWEEKRKVKNKIQLEGKIPTCEMLLLWPSGWQKTASRSSVKVSIMRNARNKAELCEILLV